MLSAISRRFTFFVFITAAAMFFFSTPNDPGYRVYRKYLPIVSAKAEEIGDSLYYSLVAFGDEILEPVRWQQGKLWVVGRWERLISLR